jgi:DnaJ family protein C protein 11
MLQDPCIGENKKLRVRYLFRNKMHEVTVDDVAVLRAPLKGARSSKLSCRAQR